MFSDLHRWRTLGVKRTSESEPVLLIKHEIGLTNYSIWLSDLDSLWYEELNRKQIIRESLRLDTSIDPSESPDQLALFLGKFDGILKGEAETSISIEHETTSELILLKLHSPLPGSLKPLEWECKLIKQPQHTLSRHLIIPLIRQLSAQHVMQSALLQEIKERDCVIESLTATMETEGVSLGRVFPHKMSFKSMSKQPTRKSLSKSVRGLIEFDEESWRSSMREVTGSQQSRAELLSRVFDSSIGYELIHNTNHSGGQNVQDPAPLIPTKSGTTEKDSQILPTRKLPPASCDDSSTTSEDSLHDHHSGETQQKKKEPPPNHFNRSSSSSDEQPNQEDAQESPKPNQGHVKFESAELTSRGQPLVQLKSKLGKIGGRKTVSSAPGDHTVANSVSPNTTTVAPSAPRSPVSHVSRPLEHLEKSPPPRETTPERANRRRRELNEQLEAQAKVPPKKKRRF